MAPLVALLLWAALPAAAAEQTRESYGELAEPICKRNTKANERILAGVRNQVKQGKLKPAARKFARASRALKQTWRQLKALPKPPADRARLDKWLGYVKEEADLFARTAAKLRSGNKAAALAMVVRLNSTANRANVRALPFDFRFCKFDPSKFT